MKYISDWFSHLRPARILASALIFVAIALTLAFPAFAAQSLSGEGSNNGTVQLDEITQKSEATADTPAMEMNPLDKPAEGGINEVQGTADRDKMFSDRETKLPVVKQIEKALKK
ncbi:hypothetical protein [Leptolyngbya sp. KIOST-1]|uniref:hypothetical protein n=1 Tax=Leptolyngbya sp. KIOST-1 TaxID=1229172 RepID=UPI000566F702|nr:hypothetical protein [Leptolyngbya sp. KIOST-1]